jgi:2-oxoglutarate ferredoxin oxidoreductase subunit alpha
MVEAIGLSSMLEVPLVVAELQRPGPATGFPTRTEQSDLKFVISGSHGEIPKMVIALKNPEDSFYQTIRAFNLADKYQMPVILLGDQYLSDCLRTIKPFDFNKIKIERHLSDDKYMKGKEYKRYELTKT